METKNVKQYTLHINNPTLRFQCQMESTDLGLLKEATERLLIGSAPRLENPPGGQGPVRIFHSSHDGGKTPIGWISVMEVPQELSIGAWIERQGATTRAA